MADCFIKVCKNYNYISMQAEDFHKSFFLHFDILCAQEVVYLADKILTIAKYIFVTTCNSKASTNYASIIGQFLRLLINCTMQAPKFYKLSAHWHILTAFYITETRIGIILIF